LTISLFCLQLGHLLSFNFPFTILLARHFPPLNSAPHFEQKYMGTPNSISGSVAARDLAPQHFENLSGQSEPKHVICAFMVLLTNYYSICLVNYIRTVLLCSLSHCDGCKSFQAVACILPHTASLLRTCP